MLIKIIVSFNDIELNEQDLEMIVNDAAHLKYDYVYFYYSAFTLSNHYYHNYYYDFIGLSCVNIKSRIMRGV